MAFLFVVGIPSFIGRSIFPMINSESMLLAIYKSSLVSFSILVSHHSTSRSQLVVGKFSFILPLISAFINPFAVLLASNEFSLIRRDISWASPGLSTFSVGQIAFPFALIPISDRFEAEDSFSLSLFFEELSFIVPTLRADKSALSAGYTLNKRPFVRATVRIKQMPFAVRQAILPLAVGIVDHSNVINRIGHDVLRARWDFKVASRQKGFQLFLYFKDIRMRFGYCFNGCKISDEGIFLLDSLVSDGYVGVLQVEVVIVSLLELTILIIAVIDPFFRTALLTHRSKSNNNRTLQRQLNFFSRAFFEALWNIIVLVEQLSESISFQKIQMLPKTNSSKLSLKLRERHFKLDCTNRQQSQYKEYNTLKDKFLRYLMPCPCKSYVRSKCHRDLTIQGTILANQSTRDISRSQQRLSRTPGKSQYKIGKIVRNFKLTE